MSKASRNAARLAAVQALYQLEMEAAPLPKLLHEFHTHRLGAKIGDVQYREAEQSFFDDIVLGAVARRDEIDSALDTALVPSGWSLERLDRLMRQLLRASAYELLARPEIPAGSIMAGYLDVAEAFYDERERGFANGVMDAVAKAVRP
jgi:transcription antitermination protein NusB